MTVAEITSNEIRIPIGGRAWLPLNNEALREHLCHRRAPDDDLTSPFHTD